MVYPVFKVKKVIAGVNDPVNLLIKDVPVTR
jgi:hypothetical protein